MTDKKIIQSLQNLCEFEYAMEGDACTFLSFHDESSCFGGTIRKHPQKAQIVEMVSHLPHLKHINLRKCKIGQIPNFISRSLEFIDLSCNDLSIVPQWVTAQAGLKSLNLGANQIQTLPLLWDLPLVTLKVHKNRLTHIPQVRETVKHLNLYLNPLNNVPEWLASLRNLEVFAFGVTNMTELPSLRTLSNIRWLTLTVNKLRRLPEDITSLQKLEGLQLAKNNIDLLPTEIGELQNLRVLTLYSNSVRELPDSFYTLRLNKLNMARNCLTEACRHKLLTVYNGIAFLSL
jgi:Leucine-rich repeat (LRR) protein